MNNLISNQLKKIKSENRLGLMTHVVAGYPSLSTSLEIIQTMCNLNVDFIEIQIPFSDPMADGPTIMNANQTALDQNVNLQDSFDLMESAVNTTDVPMLFMSYSNILFKNGIEAFCKKAKSVGASGLIIPDIPLEMPEYQKIKEICNKLDLTFMTVLSPNNSESRLNQMAGHVDELVYLPGRKGITGINANLQDSLKSEIQLANTILNCAVAVGFGIRTTTDITLLKKANADVAVIGSALIDNIDKSDIQNSVKRFLKPIIDTLPY